MFNVPGAVSDFQADTSTGLFEFGLSEAFRNVARVQVKRFNPQAQAISSTFIHPQHGNSLIAAKVAPGDSAEKLIIGAYTLRDLRYGQGIFTKQLFTETPTQFFDFTTFTHFFDYMPQGRKTRVGRRIERYQQRREVLKLRYRLLLHDIMPHPDGYLLVAEAYYPKYRSESIMLSTEFRVFEGFRYTHAIICLFDKSGNLIWDNSLPIKDVMNMTIEPLVQACPAPQGAILAYAKDEKIYYKNITPDSATANYLSTTILPHLPTERIDYTEEADLEHWYGQHFLAFGFQKIISRNNNRRYVFYINKISFQGDQAKALHLDSDKSNK